jgi:hypothetical protein
MPDVEAHNIGLTRHQLLARIEFLLTDASAVTEIR